MLGADTVMDAIEPRFQVRENEVNHRHELFGDLWVATFGDGVMIIALLSEAAITAPVVADDQRARHDGALDEPAQRVGATVSSDGQSDSPGVPTILTLILRGAGFAVADLDGGCHKRLVMYTAPFAARLGADPAFIYFHMVPRLPADSVLVGAHHSRTELVKNSECRFVSLQVELPLELYGRYARGETDNQIGGPKPCAQSCVAALHDGAGQQAGLATALAALQYAQPGSDAEGLSDNGAIGTNKAIGPTGALKIGSARRIIGKQLLKFRERLRKRYISALLDVHQLRGIRINHGSPFPTHCWPDQQLSGKYYI